jgi:hypothetical protein
MSRTVTAALQVELSKTITRLGYLLSFTFPAGSPIRMCNIGTVNWMGSPYIDYDFTLSGIGSAAERTAEPSLSIQNLDSVIAATFIDANFALVTVDAWQVAPAAVSTLADVVSLGRYMVGEYDLELEKMTMHLIPEGAIDDFSPRLRVDPANGLKFALPRGKKIPWGSEIYVAGSADG